MTEVHEPTAIQMWAARQGVQVSGLRRDQIIREELDKAREQVELMVKEIRVLTEERDNLAAEVENWRHEWDFQSLLAGRLATANCELIGERDRARDLAIRAGAFDE